VNLRPAAVPALALSMHLPSILRYQLPVIGEGPLDHDFVP
jgi:hypothetical protein